MKMRNNEIKICLIYDVCFHKPILQKVFDQTIMAGWEQFICTKGDQGGRRQRKIGYSWRYRPSHSPATQFRGNVGK